MEILNILGVNSHHFNRETFVEYHIKKQPSEEIKHLKKLNSKFDILSEKTNSKRKESGKINLNYLIQLKEKLEIPEIKDIRNYTDKLVAHSEFEPPEIKLSISKIQKCHESIIEVYKNIMSNFFYESSISSFGKTNLLKEQVLSKADKPYYFKAKEQVLSKAD
jgi:hypothetical protein